MEQCKTCASCRDTKPVDAFHRSTRRNDGREPYCKVCRVAMRRGENPRRPDPLKPAVEPKHKICSSCGETKHFDEYYRRKRDNSVVGGQCKCCVKARQAAIRDPLRVTAPKLPSDSSGKVCPKCRDYKLYERFRRPVSGEIGTYCHPCQCEVNRGSKVRRRERENARRRAEWAKPVDPAELKRCPKCATDKPRSEFGPTGKQCYCKPCRVTYARNWHRRNQDRKREQTWGLTSQGYAELLERQGGGCAICGTKHVVNGRWRNESGYHLHVDHDHVTGEIRGLLCNRCNPALGMLDDDVERFVRAIDYLKNPPAMQ